MTRLKPTRGRLLALSASTAVSVLAAWSYLGLRGSRTQTVAEVDTTAAIIELLGKRHVDASAPPRGRAGAPWPPRLVREPLDEATAALYFPGLRKGKRERYDPVAYLRHDPNWTAKMVWEEHPDGWFTFHTNAQGFNEDEDVLPKTGLRVLVAGDSHVAGVCNNSESFPNVLEALFATEVERTHVDVVNAAQGGYCPYNYLGTLELFGDLEPDVFVMVVYGGNDFNSMMVLQRYFERREPPVAPPRRLPASWGTDALVSQELRQAGYFDRNEDDLFLAPGILASITAEVRERCRALGAALVCVYLPPPSRGQPAIYAAKAEEILADAGVEAACLESSDVIADRWLEWLGQEGVARVDLRDVFRGIDEPLYWDGDKHINVRAHALVAGVLRPVVQDALERE